MNLSEHLRQVYLILTGNTPVCLSSPISRSAIKVWYYSHRKSLFTNHSVIKAKIRWSLALPSPNWRIQCCMLTKSNPPGPNPPESFRSTSVMVSSVISNGKSSGCGTRNCPYFPLPLAVPWDFLHGARISITLLYCCRGLGVGTPLLSLGMSSSGRRPEDLSSLLDLCASTTPDPQSPHILQQLSTVLTTVVFSWP